jgi:hypothetical protein
MPVKVLTDLRRRLEPLGRATSPLNVPPPRSTRFGSPLVLSRVHWVEPKLCRGDHLFDLDGRRALASHGLHWAAGGQAGNGGPAGGRASPIASQLAIRERPLRAVLCENSADFSHACGLGLFSRSEVDQKEKNREKFSVARSFAFFSRLFTQPRRRTDLYAPDFCTA